MVNLIFEAPYKYPVDNVFLQEIAVVCYNYKRQKNYEYVEINATIRPLIKIGNNTYKIASEVLYKSSDKDYIETCYSKKCFSFTDGVLILIENCEKNNFKDKIDVIPVFKEKYNRNNSSFLQPIFSQDIDMDYGIRFSNIESSEFLKGRKERFYLDSKFIKTIINHLNIPCPDNISETSLSHVERFVFLYDNLPEISELIKNGYINYAFKISKYANASIKRKVEEINELSAGKKYNEMPEFILKATNGDAYKSLLLLDAGIDNEEKLKVYKSFFMMKPYDIQCYKRVLKGMYECLGFSYEESVKMMEIIWGNSFKGQNQLYEFKTFEDRYSNKPIVPANWPEELLLRLSNKYNYHAITYYNELLIDAFAQNEKANKYPALSEKIISFKSFNSRKYFENDIASYFDYYFNFDGSDGYCSIVVELSKISDKYFKPCLIFVYDFYSNKIFVGKTTSNASALIGEYSNGVISEKTKKNSYGLRYEDIINSKTGLSKEDVAAINDYFAKAYNGHIIKALSA